MLAMNTDNCRLRRDLLAQAATFVLATPAISACAQTQAQPQAPKPMTTPAEPSDAMRSPAITRRTPGKPGDFNFLEGNWRIANQRRVGERWEAFEGQARCFTILDGVCSVEELRVPSSGFAGMGLRLLDVKQQLWRDHWVNAKFGVVGADGLPGSFENGAGIFESEETDNGVLVKYRSVWDRITATTCRWQQGASRDGGRTWLVDWSMDWTRLG